MITINAESGRGYMADTTVEAYTVILPDSPKHGITVGVTDYAGTFAANNCTVDPNGNPLVGSLSVRILNQNNRSETYKFVEDAWILIRDNEV